MSQTKQVRYGDQIATVHLRSRTSQKNSIQIRVQPEGRVEALSPTYACDEQVQKALDKRAPWIFKQLRIFETHRKDVSPRSYIGGESHYYLGRRYVLRVIALPRGELSRVKLVRGTLEVRTHYKSKSKIKVLLDNWYRERAKQYLPRRLKTALEQAVWLEDSPDLRIRAMTKQWGNCSISGVLTLNTHLIKAPRECIDYVIQHELCHFVERNHSNKFYRLLKQLAPEWKQTKQRLDRLAQSIL